MKLNELFYNQVDEAFGGLGSSIARKTAAAVNPTLAGKGARDLENGTNKLTKKWSMYRGQTKATPNAANIEHWVKNKLGLDDPEIWSQAVEEFSQEYPKAGVKYKDQEKLDINEVSNFLNKLLQVRWLNPNKRLWTTIKPSIANAKPPGTSS